MRNIALAAAVLAIGPTPAWAQFTTVLTPAPRAAPAPAAERADTALVDTATREPLRQMRAWVDSAAAALEIDARDPAPATAADTLVVAPERQAPARPAVPARAEATVAFREGAPAPDTATSLPMLALIAVGALAIGGALLWRNGA